MQHQQAEKSRLDKVEEYKRELEALLKNQKVRSNFT